MRVLARPPTILDPHRRLILRAALGEGPRAAAAYRAWREHARLEDLGICAFRVLAQLVGTAVENGIDDPDMARIRGAAKHTWINNMRRTRALGEALAAIEGNGVEALLIKGAALFARYPPLAAQRVAEDYDILVRRIDAVRAVEALLRAGFRPHGARADLFAAVDFDVIHGAHFVGDGRDGSLDLHWWPLPRWNDRTCVDEMFEAAEATRFAGRRVRIPCLADQLFLAVARPEPWEGDEVFLRAVETIHLLRNGGDAVEWDLFLRRVLSLGCQAMAAGLLDLVRTEARVAVPTAVADRLSESSRAFGALELSLRSRPPHARTLLHRLVLRTIEAARTAPGGPAGLLGSIRAVGRCPGLWTEIVRGARRELGGWLGSGSLERIWSERAGREISCDTGPAFVEGFSFPEDDGRWTDGETAVVAVPVDAEPGRRVKIRLSAMPFLPAGTRSFRFETCGGVGLSAQHVVSIGQSYQIDVTVDARVLGNGPPRALLVLRLPDAGCPLALGLSDDPRLLGLLVQRVQQAAAS